MKMLIDHIESLTTKLNHIPVELIDDMRTAGLADGEILEINQVASYFAYANRTANGLGVTTELEELGLSPASSDGIDDWQHQ